MVLKLLPIIVFTFELLSQTVGYNSDFLAKELQLLRRFRLDIDLDTKNLQKVVMPHVTTMSP